MMRYKAVFVAVAMAMAFSAFAVDPTITVEARQRYPWNGLVDLKFAVTGTSGTKYDTSFAAKDMVGNTNITMKTIRKADGAAAATKEPILPGTYNWVWDAAADLPKDFKCDRVTVTGTTVEPEPLYMVIDLSGGANAKSYPVSYLADVPSGGWTDTYKTTKLVLRRVKKGTNSAGGSMTKDMWVGVFELTEQQYAIASGYGELFPLDWVHRYPSYNVQDPVRPVVGASENDYSTGHVGTFFNNGIKSKVSSLSFVVPTPEQWMYACRAGTTTLFNNGTNTENGMKQVGRYSGNKSDGKGGYDNDITKVGMYLPNAWGLYDMHGNASEVTNKTGDEYRTYYCYGGSVRNAYTDCTANSYCILRLQWFADGFSDKGPVGYRVFATDK